MATKHPFASLLCTLTASALISACVSDNAGPGSAATLKSGGMRTNAAESVAGITNCAPTDKPETALQGQVPITERSNGRSTQGYNCNLTRVGQFQGEGSTWVNASDDTCAYMATAFAGNATKRLHGVQVIDVSDTRNPRYVKSLNSPAFNQGTWETLKVHSGRKLLAGVSVGPIEHVLFFDIYDISGDCKNPRWLNPVGNKLALPPNFIGHEGNFSPDGRTYWATGANSGSITAIDISDPTQPRMLLTTSSLYPNHGMGFSDDGKRMYLTSASPAGIIILDISDIQERKALPQIRTISTTNWNDGDISQHAIPVSYGGVPHLIVVDEFGTGGTRILNIADERKPTIISHLRLAIQLPENAQQRRNDLGNNGLFGYEAHYCTVNQAIDPTRLACGYFQSGVRLFDISNPLKPREIAYYNPPAQAGKASQLPGSEHAGPVTSTVPSVSDARNQAVGVPTKVTLQADMSTDWCSSPPRFVGNQLWVVCQDNGFMVLEYTGTE